MERCITKNTDCQDVCIAQNLLKRMDLEGLSEGAVITYTQMILGLAKTAECDYIKRVEESAMSIEKSAAYRPGIFKYGE